MKEIVAQYALKTESGVEIDLKGLARNEDFRKEVIKEVNKRIGREDVAPCVIVPAYKPGACDNHLGSLINELALGLQVKTLVTGNVKNISSLRVCPEEVLIIKQSFRAGTGLQEQIATLKNLGVKKVSVLCFIAHNTGRMQGFGHENGAEIEALVPIDDIRYIE